MGQARFQPLEQLLLIANFGAEDALCFSFIDDEHIDLIEGISKNLRTEGGRIKNGKELSFFSFCQAECNIIDFILKQHHVAFFQIIERRSNELVR